MARTTYILQKRLKRRQNQGTGKRLFGRIFLILFILGVSAGILLLLTSLTTVAAVYAYFTQDLPDFTEIESLGQTSDTFETTKIYALGNDQDGDGSREWVLIHEIIDPLGGDREWLKFAQMPPKMVNATVAIEDKTFWNNQGFDLEGIGRAFYQYILQGGSIQGGSSITQQLVKNNLIEPERRVVGEKITFDDYQRKVEELLLAQEMSRVYTKEQVIEWYLNTNFYGNLAYGIEAAARIYFDKPAAQLTLAEAAMLAAIPQSPAINPIDNPEEAKIRQELVLDAMFREGYISREELVTAKYTPIEAKSSIANRFDIIAPHFALYVQKELERRFGTEMVLGGGLQVYTSLDLEMQRQAECLVKAQVERLSGKIGGELPADELVACDALEFLMPARAGSLGINHDVNNAALVALDPTTGEIKAMVGSKDYWDDTIDGSFNVAVDGLRQPGSSFKPFTYITAFSQGYTAASMVLDVETDFGTSYNGIAYVPQNYDRTFHGPMRIRTALANSYNVPAVEVMSWVGIESVIRTAHSMGITSLDGDYGLSLTLGGGEVKLLDMVYAYSVMNNMGVMVGQPVPEEQQRLGYRTLDPVSIIRVEDRAGTPLYQYTQPTRREILTPQLAYLITHILSDRNARCPAFGCPNALELPDNRLAAAKTGTTNDYRDNWVIGYTPQLVVGVWMGNTDNSPMKELAGSIGAAPIWRALMIWSLQDQPILNWQRPIGLSERSICNPSGLLPNGVCPQARELFIEGTEPTLIDNLYQAFRINRENGRLATIDTPPELIETKVYLVYPDRAADWVSENKIEQPPTEFDTLTGLPTPSGPVAILSPQPFDYVKGQLEIVGNAQSDNFAYYRLAYFKGLDPVNITPIVDLVPEQKENQPLGVWDVGNLDGLYTILLSVVRTDGTFTEASVQVTIDNSPPTANILFPLPDQTIFTDEEVVLIQAQVADDISIARVEFYAGNAGVPFAISTVPPYTEKWKINGAGCLSFHVVAVDSAGNKTTSPSIPVCLVAR